MGLRFCVVCGRHVSTDNLGKYGGLRGGFRPADITRRLDEIISVTRFKKSRQTYAVQKAVRFTAINTIYVVVATGLFYSAVLYSLELLFPGKFKETQMPVQVLTGLFNQHKDKIPLIEKESDAKAPEVKDKATNKKPDAKAKKPTQKVKKKKKRRKKRTRRRRRTRSTSKSN